MRSTQDGRDPEKGTGRFGNCWGWGAGRVQGRLSLILPPPLGGSKGQTVTFRALWGDVAVFQGSTVKPVARVEDWVRAPWRGGLGKIPAPRALALDTGRPLSSPSLGGLICKVEVTL